MSSCLLFSLHFPLFFPCSPHFLVMPPIYSLCFLQLFASYISHVLYFLCTFSQFPLYQVNVRLPSFLFVLPLFYPHILPFTPHIPLFSHRLLLFTSMCVFFFFFISLASPSFCHYAPWIIKLYYTFFSLCPFNWLLFFLIHFPSALFFLLHNFPARVPSVPP